MHPTYWNESGSGIFSTKFNPIRETSPQLRPSKPLANISEKSKKQKDQIKTHERHNIDAHPADHSSEESKLILKSLQTSPLAV
jgi:hypothetical protein